MSNTPLDAFKSPADPNVAANGVNYLTVVGEKAVFTGSNSTRLTQVVDGTSNTVVIVEVQGVPGSWSAPIDLRHADSTYELGAAPGQFNSPYPQGLQALLLDGTATFITTRDIKGWLPPAFTRAGNDYVGFQ